MRQGKKIFTNFIKYQLSAVPVLLVVYKVAVRLEHVAIPQSNITPEVGMTLNI
jgi:hypothetical protein